MRIWGKLCFQSISAWVQGSLVPLLYIRLNVNMCTITCGGESNNADNGSLCASWLWMCAAVEASLLCNCVKLCKRLTHDRKYIKKTYWLTCKAEWNWIGLNIECEMCFFSSSAKMKIHTYAMTTEGPLLWGIVCHIVGFYGVPQCAMCATLCAI